MRTNKFVFQLLAVLLVGTMLISACGPTATEAPLPHQPPPLTRWLS